MSAYFNVHYLFCSVNGLEVEQVKNIFAAIPDDLTAEVFENLVENKNVKIERIISKGTVHRRAVGMIRGTMNG